MHLLLVPAPLFEGRRTMPYFPLGILSLHQVLSNAGHDCTIYYPTQDAAKPAEPDAAIQRWAADIVVAAPDLVGFSTMCNTYPLVLLLARAVKHLSPQTTVVLGGPQASVVAEESMAAFPWIDYVVRGEAENVVLDLVRVVEQGGEPQGAAGITYRSNGRTVSSPPAPLLSNLDSLPLPDYQAYPHFHEALLVGIPPFRDGFLPFEPGRGCPHGCSFCSTSAFWQRRVRQKSPGLLADQLKMIVHKYKVKSLGLVQDIFGVDEGWFADFLGAMEAGGEVTWACYLRADSVETSTLDAMKRAGCRQIYFGVESGSQRVQKRIGKNLDLSQARKTIEAAVASGIRVTTSFIVGFPWETSQDLQETLSLHRHFLSIGVAKSRIQLLCPLPKTPFACRFASRLRLAPVPSFMSRGLEDFRTAEMERMIRQYSQIFSNFYYVKPEFVSREEFVAATWAGNALLALRSGENRVTLA